MAAFQTALDAEQVLYLFSPLIVPVGFAVLGWCGEAAMRALGRRVKA